MPRNATSTTSSSASRRPNPSTARRTPARPTDPCAIDGDYVPVPAASLAALWCAFRDGRIGLADARVWCALADVEAGLRAAAMSGRQKRVERPTVDQVAAAYWGGRDPADHDRRVVRQRLNRLAGLGLARDASAGPRDAAGRQRWATAAAEGDGDAERLLDGFRCPAGRSLRLPRRWLAGFARHLTAGTFGFAVAAAFACGWGRGGESGGRPAWSGRVSAGGAAGVLGVPARTLRAARATLLASGHLEPMPDSGWAARRWGRRLMMRPGPVVNARRPASRPSRGARRPAAETASSARRAAAPDQTQTRLWRNQTPRPPAAAGPGVCRRGGEGRPEHRTPARRPDTRRRASQPRDPWRDVDLASTDGTGRLYRRLTAAGVLAGGPRDAVRFFAAAVRARAVSRRPVALLRWLVTHGRWELLTDAQDAQGHRDWKAWQRASGTDPAAEWEPDEDEACPPAAERRSGRGSRVSRPAPAARPAVAPASGVCPSPADTRPRDEAAAPTLDQWPADVRVLLGRRAMGRARGWDEAAVDANLARRDGWTTDRVRSAARQAREHGLLDAEPRAGAGVEVAASITSTG